MEKFGIHEGALPLVLEPYNPKLGRTTALLELIFQHSGRRGYGSAYCVTLWIRLISYPCKARRDRIDW
jgi:hypothetical protein